MNKQFLTFNNNLYILKRVIKEELEPNVDVWKEHLRADIVLKKDGLFYFVELVPELEILEETKSN
jgi:hypothetical protein